MANLERSRFTEHQFTAYVDYYLQFGAYLNQYKSCYDILIEHVATTSFHVDHLAYPILFLARHCMELGLKANIRYFSYYSGRNDFTKAGTHHLADLFGAFKMHVEKTISNLKNKFEIDVAKEDERAFVELCKEVEKLNNVFHELDKSSHAFRYPVDLDQNPSFTKGQRVSILDVNELLERSMLLFYHTSDVFAKYTAQIDNQEIS